MAAAPRPSIHHCPHSASSASPSATATAKLARASAITAAGATAPEAVSRSEPECCYSKYSRN